MTVMTSKPMSDVFSIRSKTGDKFTKMNEKHQEAIAHFRENLPKDFRRYAYLPPKGYRCRRYDNVRQGDVPRLGETISLKGEFVTAVAKDSVRFPQQGRYANIVNVLFYSEGKDPDTQCHAKFFWDNWETVKWQELQDK